MAPSSDCDPLLERLQRLDPLAFDALYQREKDGLYGFLLRLVRDPHTAADLFQNVWLKLARHATRLRPDSNLRAWLFTVARHEYVSFRRAQALDLSRLLVLSVQPERPAPGTELDPRLTELDGAFAELGDADREVLLLSVAEGLDAAAGALVLGISPPAFRQRLARARRRLAERLATRSETSRRNAEAPAALRGGH